MFNGKRFNILLFLSVLYVVLPNLIFYIGFLRPLVSIPAFLLLSASLFFASFSKTECWKPDFDKKNIIKGLAAIFIVALWVFLSGIGGFVWQNTDHAVRNPFFRLLVSEPWPLVDHERAIVYYLGFWLPAAVAGKIFGLTFGLFFEQFWASAGILLFYALWCSSRKKLELWPLLLFVFFSGVDYLGLLFCEIRYRQPIEPLVSALHLEGWFFNVYQYSCFTTQLFWVFNQAIPVWLAMMLLHTERSAASALLLFACLLLSSTLPALGLVPFVIWLYVKNPKEIFTFQNIVGFAVAGCISYLYLTNNSSARVAGTAFAVSLSAKRAAILLAGLAFVSLPFFVNKKSAAVRASLAALYNICFFGALLAVKFAAFYKTDKLHIWVWHVIFFMVEAGIVALFIMKREKRDPFFWVAIASLFLIPLIQVGRTTDFCMRASIPSLLVLCVLTADFLSFAEPDGQKKLFFARPKFKKALLILVLLVGALTPIHEFYRTIVNSFSGVQQRADILRDDLFFEPVYNTSGAADNFFFRNMAKRRAQPKR